MASDEPRGDGPILFYDGECGLCAKSVQWCLDHDAHAVLRYAPLQGATYAALDVPKKPSGLGTVVLLDERGLHTESNAVLRIARHIGGPWRVFGAIARVIPRALRDVAYRHVARHRIAWFGTVDACRLPTPATRTRFLP